MLALLWIKNMHLLVGRIVLCTLVQEFFNNPNSYLVSTFTTLVRDHSAENIRVCKSLNCEVLIKCPENLALEVFSFVIKASHPIQTIFLRCKKTSSALTLCCATGPQLLWSFCLASKTLLATCTRLVSGLLE